MFKSITGKGAAAYLPAILLAAISLWFTTGCNAQKKISDARLKNPFIRHLYTADPSAHVWADGRLYVYASHDIAPPKGCDLMDQYHVFSTDDMLNWKDHGEILRASQVPWGRKEGGFMWAPDCAYKSGIYYFYFPHPSGTEWNATWKIGVATSKSPASGFEVKGYLEGLKSMIDPCVFVDDDGQAYFYYGGGGTCEAGKLKDNMMEIDGEMTKMEGLTDFHEASWIHKKDGIYYLSYSDNHDEKMKDGVSGDNRMRYATSKSPLGPWKSEGIYMDPTDSYTNHGSIVKYKGQWYSFYHNSILSNHDWLRSICVDKLYYNADGSIKKVVQTSGITKQLTRKIMNKQKLNTLVSIILFAVLCSCSKNKSSSPETPDKPGEEIDLSPSPPGDVVGKVTVGYQGWFAANGDGSPINAWWHWTQDWAKSPGTSNSGIKSWPDVREYTSTYATSFANLGNGEPAKLFSSYNDQTVNTQFLWMKQNGLDVAALQRFNPNGIEGPVRDAITAKVKTAAELHGRKFYIMYDISGWTNMQTEIKTDWTNKMSSYTSSSAYAKQNGKPVICIWGFGFNDNNHTFSAAACLDVINWFKGKGCYVIGGVPTNWRTQTSDSRPYFLLTYKALDMISPWMIGRIGTINEIENKFRTINVPDMAYCKANGIDYQPCVLPGDLQEHQRLHGDFMWRQFYNLKSLAVQGLYISMFDEYNEGNQIAKTAESSAYIPAGSSFVTLDEDGTACSSDYYLRLSGDGAKMFRAEIPLTATRPTKPIL